MGLGLTAYSSTAACPDALGAAIRIPTKATAAIGAIFNRCLIRVPPSGRTSYIIFV